MFPEILNSNQKKILPGLAKALTGSNMYLAGGTALALQVGHRPSVDFDWFSTKIGNPEQLFSTLRQYHDFTVISVSFETIYLNINDVMVSFIGYKYPMLQVPFLWNEHGIIMAGIDDITCMKLSAITNRGARKDFIDLHHIISNFHPLPYYLELFSQKYQQTDIGHIIRSLIFFEDAEEEPDIQIFTSVTWPEIKRDFKNWVKNLS